jgi:hypothetical protein
VNEGTDLPVYLLAWLYGHVVPTPRTSRGGMAAGTDRKTGREHTESVDERHRSFHECLENGGKAQL